MKRYALMGFFIGYVIATISSLTFVLLFSTMNKDGDIEPIRVDKTSYCYKGLTYFYGSRTPVFNKDGSLRNCDD